jgi:hypothetical protein
MEMASIPWGEGIEAIVFHTIVDQRGCGELLPFTPLVGLRRQARTGRRSPLARRMSVSTSLSPPRPPGSRPRRPMLAPPAVPGPRSRAPLSGNGRLMPGG